jgi:hypothetical protein
MNRKSLFALLFISTSLFGLTEQEIEIKKKELELKERELELKEKESSEKQINVIIHNANQSSNEISNQGGSNSNQNVNSNSAESSSDSDVDSTAVAVSAPLYEEKRDPQGIYLSINGLFGEGTRKSKREFDIPFADENEIEFPDFDESYSGGAVRLGFGEFDANRIEISYISRTVEVEDLDDTEYVDERSDMNSLALDFVITGFQSGNLLPYLKVGAEYGEYEFSDSDLEFYNSRDITLEDDSRSFYGGRLGLGLFYKLGDHFEITLGGEYVYLKWADIEAEFIEQDRIDKFTAENSILSLDVGLTIRF